MYILILITTNTRLMCDRPSYVHSSLSVLRAWSYVHHYVQLKFVLDYTYFQYNDELHNSKVIFVKH